MDGEDSSHAERQRPKYKTTDATNIGVRFSPQVVEKFSKLEGLVRDSSHFDSALRMNLQHLASGKEVALNVVVPGMLHLARETMQHAQATGDTNAVEALWELTSSLGEPNAMKAQVDTPSVKRGHK